MTLEVVVKEDHYRCREGELHDSRYQIRVEDDNPQGLDCQVDVVDDARYGRLDRESDVSGQQRSFDLADGSLGHEDGSL